MSAEQAPANRPMTVDEVCAEAQEWMDYGIGCFPIALNRLPSKTEKTPLTKHGHQSATLDTKKFRQLVIAGNDRLEPGHELGFGCHSTNEVLFDFDEKNGAKGAEVRERLTATYGEEMGAVAFRSISGATNWLMTKRAREVPISNTSPWTAFGVDLRSDNGWFVPPGVHCSWGSWSWSNGALEDLERCVVPTAVWDLLRVAGEHAAPAHADQVEQWLDANELTHMPNALRDKQLADHLRTIASASNRHPAMWDALVWIRHQDRGVDRRAAFEAIEKAWRARMIVDGETGRVDECREKLAHLVGSSLEWEAERAEERPIGEPPGLTEEERALPKVEILRRRMLSTDQLDQIPLPESLVAGYLFRNSLAWILGPSGVGKSFVAVDLALKVGTGGGWWHDNLVQGGKVLYIVAEGASGMTLRTRAWRKFYGVADPPDIAWMPNPVPLFDQSWADALGELVEGAGFDLIIVDTLARSSLGAEENSAKDTGVIIDNLERIRVRSGGACVLLVHHTGKDIGAGGRGSTAYKGAMESEIMVTGAIRSTVKVEATKQKNVECPPPIQFRPEVIELGGIGHDGEQLSSVVLVKAGADELDAAGADDSSSISGIALRQRDTVMRMLQRLNAPITRNRALEELRKEPFESLGIDFLGSAFQQSD